MPNTPNLDLPYPAPGAVTNVPQDIENLATALDGLVMPGGRMYQNSAQVLVGNFPGLQVLNMVQDFAKAGVTCAGNTITVPLPGTYIVSGQVSFNVSGIALENARFITYIYKNGAALLQNEEDFINTSVLTPLTAVPSPHVSDSVRLLANDQLTLRYYLFGLGSSNSSLQGSPTTFLSAQFLSS